MSFTITEANEDEGTVTYLLDYGGKEVLQEQLRVADFADGAAILAHIAERDQAITTHMAEQKKVKAMPAKIKALAAEYASSKAEKTAEEKAASEAPK